VAVGLNVFRLGINVVTSGYYDAVIGSLIKY